MSQFMPSILFIVVRTVIQVNFYQAHFNQSMKMHRQGLLVLSSKSHNNMSHFQPSPFWQPVSSFQTSLGLTSKQNQVHLLPLRNRLAQLTGSSLGFILEQPATKNTTARTQDERYRYCQKLIVAKYFCSHGPGATLLNDQVKKNEDFMPVNSDKYDIIAKSGLAETYKKLEFFLKDYCKLPIAVKQTKTRLYSILYECRKTIEWQYCVTFLDFVKYRFGLQDVTISEKSAIELYLAIQFALFEAEGQMDMQPADSVYYSSEIGPNSGYGLYSGQKKPIDSISLRDEDTEFDQFIRLQDNGIRNGDAMEEEIKEEISLGSLSDIESINSLTDGLEGFYPRQ